MKRGGRKSNDEFDLYACLTSDSAQTSFLLHIKDLHIEHQTSFEFSPTTCTMVVSSDVGGLRLSNSTYSGHKDTTTFGSAAGSNVLIFAGKVRNCASGSSKRGRPGGYLQIVANTSF